VRYINFNPKIHKDKKLYEIVPVGDSDDVTLEEVKVDFSIASITPWFFVVEDTE